MTPGEVASPQERTLPSQLEDGLFVGARLAGHGTEFVAFPMPLPIKA